jgi:hypothetical protein
MLVAMMGNEHKAYWDCKTDPSLPLSLTYLPSLPPLLTYLLTYSLTFTFMLFLSPSQTPLEAPPPPCLSPTAAEISRKPQKHCRT